MPLADGPIWRNVVTPEKSQGRRDLAEFRASGATTCSTRTSDDSTPRCPVIVQWDDHEVTNNWYPGEVLTDTW